MGVTEVNVLVTVFTIMNGNIVYNMVSNDRAPSLVQ